MRRKLFFWLEKLKITRAERHAVSLLMALLGALVLANAIVEPSSPFDDEYYSELEKKFSLRTAQLQQKEQRILDRFKIAGTTAEATSDTLPDEHAPEHENTETQTVQAGELINVNTANLKTLQTLTGIGAAYATRIMAYRQRNGAFKTKDDLLKIKGIGSARLAKIEPYITFGTTNSAGIDSSLTNNSPIEHTVEKVEAKGKGEVENEIKAEAKFKGQFVINVNTADAASLQKLSGIGPAYASRIVEYRLENGPFATKDQLLQIKGIGKKRLDKIKPFIKLTEQ